MNIWIFSQEGKSSRVAAFGEACDKPWDALVTGYAINSLVTLIYAGNRVTTLPLVVGLSDLRGCVFRP